MSVRYNILMGMLISASFLTATIQAVAEDGSSIAKSRADQLVKAAQNYLSAADIRFAGAKALLSTSREYRKQEYATEKERTSNMKTAGHKEIEAGNLFVAACGGYDKAAEVLSRASGEYKKAGNTEQADELASLAQSTRAIATHACELSAESYEASAEAFSSVDNNQMAASNEKAARMRETLSGRLK